MDLGCYVLHALRHLIGEPEIMAAESVNENGVDAYLKADLDIAGVSGRLMCDMRERAARKDYFVITGTQASLRFEGFVAPHLGHEIKISRSGAAQIYEIDGPATYAAQLQSFIHYINGKPSQLPMGDAILQSAAIDKIYSKINR